MNDLSKDMICKICDYLDNRDVFSMTLVNKNISRKTNHYMMQYFTYDGDVMIINMMLDKINKYNESHLKYVKNITSKNMNILLFFNNKCINLMLDCHFHKTIHNTKYNNLTKLTFDDNFNNPIDNLNCPNLTELTFGVHFNKPIEALQCPKLLKLIFGHQFNQPIEKLHCPQLSKLAFYYEFNQPIKKLHCPQLSKLKLGYNFDQPLNELYYPQLNKLTIEWRYTRNNNYLNIFKQQYPYCKIKVYHHFDNETEFF